MTKNHNHRMSFVLRLLYIAFMVWIFGLYPSFGVLAEQAHIPGFYGNTGRSLPQVLPNTVPQLRHPDIDPQKTGKQALPDGSADLEYGTNRLDIYQKQNKIILDWNTFNIGKDAETQFHQDGGSALNRIYDKNPSQIYGKLTADGKIYLINQNGILFGPDARVNVNTLVASSLNISNDDFIEGIRHLVAQSYNEQADNYTTPDASVVSNHGTILTDKGGSVFFMAPRVENSGTIVSEAGQTGLIAGEDIHILERGNGFVVVTDPGDDGNHAINMAGGQIIADAGKAGLYGREVIQEGLIQSVTALKKAGTIELWAADRVYLGKDSLTTTPISTSDEAAIVSTDDFPIGSVDILGLETELPTNDAVTPTNDTRVSLIEHAGRIVAPAGDIKMKAKNRIFFETGSLVDVSGSRVTLPADSVTLSIQLNSSELRDDYLQQNSVLRGETITINSLLGSGIGDMSPHLTVQEITALQRYAFGGLINLDVSSKTGDIIVKTDAQMDISGGAVEYSQGYADTSMLLSGVKTYNIENAPGNIRYDQILGMYEKVNKRFGMTETYEGVYAGGAVPIRNYWAGHVEGKDAGTAIMNASRIVLDGRLVGSVAKGLYQTDADDPEDEFKNLSAIGLRQPAKGTLVLGDPRDYNSKPVGGHDFRLNDVITKAYTQPIAADFGADPISNPFPEERQGKTVLSAKMINAADLSNLEIYSNGLIETSADTRIILQPGNQQGGWVDADNKAIGRFYAVGGSILHQGEINVPGGKINMIIRETVTDSFEGSQKVVLADGSKLLAAGERIDNSLVGKEGGLASIQSGNITGGYITLADDTASKGQGVFIMPGAVVDVSGGYRINEKDEVTPGNAGTLEVSGPTLFLEGDLRGHSIVGGNGGSIMLHADQVSVVMTGDAPDFANIELTPDNLTELVDSMGIGGKLILGQNRLDLTGFANIELKSLADLIVEEGVVLKPSLAKMRSPAPASKPQSGIPNNIDVFFTETATGNDSNGLQLIAPEFAGDTSITLKAGQTREFSSENDDILFTRRIHLKTGSKLQTAPGGDINMSAPGILMNGELQALSGAVSLTSTYADLVLGGDSRIFAGGYNKPDTSVIINGLPTGYTPQSGGSVSLTAGKDDESITGNLVFESGAVVDVSGSNPVESFIFKADGGYTSIRTAGDSGSVELAYKGDLILDGALVGNAKLAGLKGGSLTIAHNNFRKENSLLTVDAGQFEDFKESGFDELTYRSVQKIALSGPMDLDIDRKLTFDAPHIEGLGSGLIRLQAPWIRIQNTREQYDSVAQYNGIFNREDPTRNAQFNLAAGWLDVEGSILLTGFETVHLESGHDLRLQAGYYNTGENSYRWEGILKTSADLTLKAGRIYPTTLSDFTILGNDRLTILRGENPAPGPVLSAGGNLTIKAENIYHEGVIAAPFGNITLEADSSAGEIILKPGSQILAAGEIPVMYGYMEEDLVWRTPDKTATRSALGIEVTETPQKSIVITGNSVELQEGSEVDVSGGGSVFSYVFQAGQQGTENPLAKKGRYVLLPAGSSPLLPGDAIFLEEGAGVAAGMYSLLPEWMAFLPGAMVVTDLAEAGESYQPGQLYSEAGFPVAQGYRTVAGTSMRSPAPYGFSVRPAAEVLAEGNFTVSEAKSGAAGNVTLLSHSVNIAGTISMEALPHFQGGTMTIGGANIAVGQITDEFTADVILDAARFSDMDLEELNIGALDLSDEWGDYNTEEVRVYAQSLKAPKVTISAVGDITLMPGAQIEARDEEMRLADLIYGYEFNPAVGIGIIEVKGVRSDDSAGGWRADIGLKGPNGVTPLELVGSGNSIRSVLYDGNSVIPRGIELPDYGAAASIGGWGLALLKSQTGDITVKNQARVAVSHEVGLDLEGQFDIEDGAVLESDRSILKLESRKILFVPSGYDRNLAEGLYLSEKQWNSLSTFDDITLKSNSDLLFLGDYGLQASGRLTIDSYRIAGTETDNLQGLISDYDGQSNVSITAPELILLNSKAPPSGKLIDSSFEDSGSITFSGDRLYIQTNSSGGNGTTSNGTSQRGVAMDGFGKIDFLVSDDITFMGHGRLSVGGDIRLKAARLTTAFYTETDQLGQTGYITTDFLIDAGGNLVQVIGSGQLPSFTAQAGGRLEIAAGNITIGKKDEDNAALIDMPGGTVALNATDSITIGQGAGIDLGGSEFAPGGTAQINAGQGALVVAQNAFIDVSAGGQGDAGDILLSAPNAQFAINGNLMGTANGGRGGGVRMDANQLGDLNALIGKLDEGGFTERMEIRTRSGDLELGSGDAGGPQAVVSARQFSLTADGGNISVQSNVVIDASGENQGGRVELYAKNDLSVYGNILASGTGEGASGGEVILSAAHKDSTGQIYMDGATIDVSGQGKGGSVHFRVNNGANSTQSSDIQGAVIGADSISAETVNYLQKSGDIGGVVTIPAPGDFAHALTDIDGGSLAVTNRTGLEIWSSKGVNLKLNQAWNLSSIDLGVLTLKSGGDLTISADLIDSRIQKAYPDRDTRYALFTNVDIPATWDMRLVAGADLSSANPLAVHSGTGDLNIADERKVYTENAGIWFAAGNDVDISLGKPGNFSYMINKDLTFNMGTYFGDIRGYVGNNLELGGSASSGIERGGGIQSALGNIDIEVGGDLRINYSPYSKSVGIRTTGGAPRIVWQPEWRGNPELWPEPYQDIISKVPLFSVGGPQKWLDTNIHSYYHHYTGEGDITLKVGGSLISTGVEKFSSEAWDFAYPNPSGATGKWTAAYTTYTSTKINSTPVGGLAAMAGGDIEVKAGASFESKAGTFGKGDLEVFAAGNLDGKFVVKDGESRLTALGNFGYFGAKHDENRTIEAFDAHYTVFAQGNAVIGEAVNPTARKGSPIFDSGVNGTLYLRYAEDASLKVKAMMGDVTLPKGGIFPAILEIEAGGNITVKDKVVLAPSRSGLLRLVAGENIDGFYTTGDGSDAHAQIIMSDIAPEAAYAYYSMPRTESRSYTPTRSLLYNRYAHGFSKQYTDTYTAMRLGGFASIEDQDDIDYFKSLADILFEPVHSGYNTLNEISAGANIQDIEFVLPKSTEISAGGDIDDIYYLGQQSGADDVSIIQAAGNIIFQDEPEGASFNVGIEQAGPGYLVVQAGNIIDLGQTRGIKSVGNTFNGSLGFIGSSLIVMSGFAGELNSETVHEEIIPLFEKLRLAGIDFSTLLAEGKIQEANSVTEKTREEVLYPFFNNYVPGKGDIDMIKSKIGVSNEDADIYIIANGNLNVGVSTFFSDEDQRQSTGIFTSGGGGINMYARGDVNVNESRVMTYRGGDITIWSDEGNINAGKGSKAAINADPPTTIVVDGIPVIQFTPPAAGSGIRALTFDPDGLEGPLTAPEPGNIYLTAPEGVIDAGEAGIAGGNVILGAAEGVLNAQNIEVGGTSVGVPSSTNTGAIGITGDTGSLNQANELAAEAQDLAGKKQMEAAAAAQLAEALKLKWLKVDFIGYDERYDEDEKE